MAYVGSITASTFFSGCCDPHYVPSFIRDVYEHAVRISQRRTAIHSFIMYLLSYEKGQQKKINPEPLNL